MIVVSFNPERAGVCAHCLPVGPDRAAASVARSFLPRFGEAPTVRPVPCAHGPMPPERAHFSVPHQIAARKDSSHADILGFLVADAAAEFFARAMVAVPAAPDAGVSRSGLCADTAGRGDRYGSAHGLAIVIVSRGAASPRQPMPLFGGAGRALGREDVSRSARRRGNCLHRLSAASVARINGWALRGPCATARALAAALNISGIMSDRAYQTDARHVANRSADAGWSGGPSVRPRLAGAERPGSFPGVNNTQNYQIQRGR